MEPSLPASPSEARNHLGYLVVRMRGKIHSLREKRDLGSCLLDDLHDTQEHLYLDFQEVSLLATVTERSARLAKPQLETAVAAPACVESKSSTRR